MNENRPNLLPAFGYAVVLMLAVLGGVLAARVPTEHFNSSLIVVGNHFIKVLEVVVVILVYEALKYIVNVMGKLQ